MVAPNITELERAVLNAVCQLLPAEDKRALEFQIASATLHSRENTGAGFFTQWELIRDPDHIVRTDTTKYHVVATISGVKDALAFILWLSDGYINKLEGYTQALNSTVGMELETIPFEITTSC